MKIYLAAKFDEKVEMNKWAAYLKGFGHEITSTWLDSKNQTDREATEEVLVQAAVDNLADLHRADVLVTKSQTQGTEHTGGGRHVEFGYAVSEGTDIIVVGPRGEHVFHYLQGVRHVPDLGVLVERLHEMDRGEC